ncbi:MAG: NAD-dependent epimerase/dehydratase family protein [Nitrososphaerota archaeon]|nr:NAD-dependent epimerase/dehydratase family protein [Nitrososphaerota archaeon]
MRFLVTGAAGFIGHHLCAALLDRGFEVWGLDDLSRGVEKRIRGLKKLGLEFIMLDIRDRVGLVDAVSKISPDVVIHLAALTSVDESFRKPGLYRAVNAGGTENVVLAANEAGAWRLIYAGSAAVYGDPIELPIREDHPARPLSPYGETKLEGEKIALTRFRGDGGAISLRLFNVYGWGQNPEYAGVITKFIERVRSGQPPIIFGDGEQTRDFVHVRDVAEAVARASEAEISGSEIFNIGSGKWIRIRDLARMVASLFGRDLEPVYAGPRPGDIRRSYADISKAEKILSWSPKIGLEEGLSNLIKTGEQASWRGLSPCWD